VGGPQTAESQSGTQFNKIRHGLSKTTDCCADSRQKLTTQVGKKTLEFTQTYV